MTWLLRILFGIPRPPEPAFRQSTRVAEDADLVFARYVFENGQPGDVFFGEYIPDPEETDRG